MKNRIYPFFIFTVLVMSFIVTYGKNGDKVRNYVFAEIFPEESEEIMEEIKTPLKVEQYSIENSIVEHDIKTIYNNNQYIGYEEVVQEGSDGMKRSVYKDYYVDGELVERFLEKETIYIDPVDEIIEVGTKEKTVATSRSGFRFTKELDMVATAYDLSYESCGKYPDDPYYGITASGTKAQPGTVAVDPNVIPLGTKLYIASTDGSPDYGFATALDTGSAIKGYRIDLFMENNSDAINFGVRQVKVYILD
ncbi:MAG TPA: hypothetical protein GX396_10910 [Tissierellia bacterium]|nr:hypothetical protein [Tissierellia bacterium]